MIAGYMGTSSRFDDAILKFAVDYAAQTRRDWEALVHARRHARPTAQAKTPTKKSSTPTSKPGKAAKRRTAR